MYQTIDAFEGHRADRKRQGRMNGDRLQLLFTTMSKKDVGVIMLPLMVKAQL